MSSMVGVKNLEAESVEVCHGTLHHAVLRLDLAFPKSSSV